VLHVIFIKAIISLDNI